MSKGLGGIVLSPSPPLLLNTSIEDAITMVLCCVGGKVLLEASLKCKHSAEIFPEGSSCSCILTLGKAASPHFSFPRSPCMAGNNLASPRRAGWAGDGGSFCTHCCLARRGRYFTPDSADREIEAQSRRGIF